MLLVCLVLFWFLVYAVYAISSLDTDPSQRRRTYHKRYRAVPPTKNPHHHPRRDCYSSAALLFDILALALLLGLISFMLCKPQLLLPALVVFDLDFTLVR